MKKIFFSIALVSITFAFAQKKEIAAAVKAICDFASDGLNFLGQLFGNWCWNSVFSHTGSIFRLVVVCACMRPDINNW